jgi:hypothetical protein
MAPKNQFYIVYILSMVGYAVFNQTVKKYQCNHYTDGLFSALVFGVEDVASMLIPIMNVMVAV